jgi:(1->4)-alpha-D-glucan 1-alpha-D-glucosylmutase
LTVPEPHRPERVPVSTYRVQVRQGFGFDDVAALADHLAALGVSHVYLSPILRATPGSAHGYDVVDHAQLSPDAGGREAFERMTAALARHGLSAVADVVPNHMAVPTPARLNAALWSVLRDGPGSPHARWFDVDWSVPDRSLLMPVLGRRIGQVLADGELSVDTSGDEPVLRYYDHEFPVRPGTADLPLPELVERQWYRLAWWRTADDELNYRRFFDVDTLAAVRVEDPVVFAATHELLLDLVGAGDLGGLRIDHPDGLADPRGYLRRLAEATDGAWVVVEKILEAEEELPDDWPCAGTTGYDALARVGGLFVDPAGAAPLSSLLAELAGDPSELADVVERSKREVIEHSLHAEIQRLTDLLVDISHADLALRDHTRRMLRDAVVELLVAMDRYRAYVVPGEPPPAESVAVVRQAAARARGRLPEEGRDALDAVAELVLGRLDGPDPERRAELIVRFQQTCGPVMAKGVEDTAFYRWHRLVSLNEVGGDPGRFGVAPEEFHSYCNRLEAHWPATMTTLSTHDTKRSEDARARLAVLSELHLEWGAAVRAWREQAQPYGSDQWPDPPTAYLFWQALVATWEFGGGATGAAAEERLRGYLEKATREAKVHTSWTNPEAGYERAVADFARGVLGDETLLASVGEFCATLDAPARVGVLGQKLVQLTMPGVPDVYQGTEIVDLSLVDPDNRRPVDVARRRELLAALDGGAPAASLEPAPDRALDLEKLLVTSRALRLRREHPEWFVGPDATYLPVATSSGNALAFARGDAAGPAAVTVATRLPVALARHGGWYEHTVALPAGSWTDVLTGRPVAGGSAPLEEVLATLPVALLVRDDF